MWRWLKIYVKLQLVHVRVQLSYGADTWIALAGMLLTQLGGLIFVYALFGQSTHIQGWTIDEIMFLYGVSLVPRGLVELLCDGQWHLRQLVNEGGFDRILLRPVPALLQVVTQAAGVHGLGSVGLGGVLLFLSVNRLDLTFDGSDVLLLCTTLVCTMIAMIAVQIAVCCVVFWEPASSSLFPIAATSVFEFTKHPLTMYGTAIRFFLSWIIPLAWVTYHPACVLLNRTGDHPAWYGPPAAAVLAILAWLVWRWGMRGYQGVGH